jgi:ribonuclease HII
MLGGVSMVRSSFNSRLDPTLIPLVPDLSYENLLWSQALTYVAGIDEAGRGALAGPVTAAALVLPAALEIAQSLAGVRDSKQMTPSQRERWATEIKLQAVSWAVGTASPQEIDAIGILPATRLAVQRALDLLEPTAEHLLLDYLLLPEYPLPQTSLIKGDQRSLSIAAASVLAKTARDAWMCELEVQFPGYGFAVHKGYGTERHLVALERLGPSVVHRKSFRPVSDYSQSRFQKMNAVAMEKITARRRIKKNASE